MAVLSDTNFPNLVNVLKRTNADGTIIDLAELLDKDLDWLEDVPWLECNNGTAHTLGDRTAIPSMSQNWRSFNGGVPTVKTDSAKFDEITGMLEAYSDVDPDLAELNGNANAFRASEAKGIIEGLNQEFARASFYENALTAPERIHGLTARYDYASGYTTSPYVIRQLPAVPGANCQSIWLLTWDIDKIFGIFPKGSSAGLKQMDRGIVPVTTADGKVMEKLREKFQWKCGVAVRDFRYAVRLQWDPTDVAFGDDKKSLYLAMQQQLGTIKKVMPSTRFYMSRTSLNKLNAQLASNSANYLEYVSAGGRRIAHFLGVPIRINDALVGETPINA